MFNLLLGTSIFFAGPVSYEGPDSPAPSAEWYGTAKVFFQDDYRRAELIYSSNSPSGTFTTALERFPMDEKGKRYYESKDNLVELALHTDGDWVADPVLTDANFNDRVSRMSISWWPDELNPYGMFRTKSEMVEREGWRVVFLPFGARSVAEPSSYVLLGLGLLVVFHCVRKKCVHGL